jgi:hypothetical protein
MIPQNFAPCTNPSRGPLQNQPLVRVARDPKGFNVHRRDCSLQKKIFAEKNLARQLDKKSRGQERGLM